MAQVDRVQSTRAIDLPLLGQGVICGEIDLPLASNGPTKGEILFGGPKPKPAPFNGGSLMMLRVVELHIRLQIAVVWMFGLGATIDYPNFSFHWKTQTPLGRQPWLLDKMIRIGEFGQIIHHICWFYQVRVCKC